jgi:glycosyltransferase involved in cell wall biosynthesis
MPFSNTVKTSDYTTHFEHELGDATFSDVSAIITLYNYEETILDTLDSLRKQSLKYNEVIILDDGSTDSGLEVAREWLSGHATFFKRCKLLQHTSNQGLGIARNTAISASSGNYVFILDADNLLFPNCLQAHKHALEQSAGHAFAYSLLERFGADQSIMNTLPWDKKILVRTNYIDAMAMIRKEHILQVGGYKKFQVMGWEDYDLWLSFAEQNLKGLLLPNIHCRYRVHPKSMLKTHTNEAERLKLLMSEMKALHPWVNFQTKP